MFEQLNSLDTNALLALNGLFPGSTDTFWIAITKTVSWLPLYAVLLHRLYISSNIVLFVKRLALVVLGVLLFDQGAEFFKYTLERPRPCHEVEGLRVLAHCSPFGFFSAHAANSFGRALMSVTPRNESGRWSGWPVLCTNTKSKLIHSGGQLPLIQKYLNIQAQYSRIGTTPSL